MYEVCLGVRNAYGADTVCYMVTIGDTPVQSVEPARLEVSVMPNPFQSILAFSVPDAAPWQRIDARLIDGMGREVARTAWRGTHSDWHLEALPRGIYFYGLVVDDGRRAAGRVVKR